MIEKDKYTDELPSAFEKLIKDKFELNLQFTKKEMDQEMNNSFNSYNRNDEYYE
jgi:hypothetical protein